jgi:hypothetical protein
LDPANAMIAANTCPVQATSVAVGGTFTCSFDADLVGLAGDPDHVDTATATVEDDEGNSVADADSATVAFLDTPPTVSVSKMPSVGSVPEPGGTVTFTVEVINTSFEDVTLTSLGDDVFGDLLDAANPVVSGNTCPSQATAVAPGGVFSCAFDADLVGNASEPDHLDTVTAEIDDGDGNLATASDDAAVSFSDVPPTIDTTKIPSVGSIAEPGGPVTFTVEIDNTSVEEVTLTGLTDDVFGDLLDAANPAVSGNTCPSQATAVAPGGVFSCAFDADLLGLAGDPDHENTVTAAARDDEGNPTTDEGSTTVVYGNTDPTISVSKTPSVGALPEPGGPVTFTVEVINTSVEPVTLVSLTDDVFGDLLDPANPAVSDNNCPVQGAAITVDGTFACSFDADVTGGFGEADHLNVVTAVVDDGDGSTANGSDDAVVTFIDVPPTLAVAKTPSVGSVPEPGGTVTFSVDVVNTSVEPVTLTSLIDDVYGDLLDPANPAPAANTCVTEPPLVAAGGTFSCTFDADVVGDHGDPDHVNVVTATVDDGDGNTQAGSDDAAVGIEASFGGLSGHLFVDYDGNGLQNAGEPDLAGVDVVIVDARGDEFRFTSDASGDWEVVVALGDATLAVDPATVPPFHTLTTGNDTQVVTVPAGGIATDPIGYRPEPASVSGTVFVDVDGDLYQSGSEPPLGGVTILLLDGDGGVVTTTTTAADGMYSFDDLVPSDYTLQIDDGSVPAGYGLTADPDGNSDGSAVIGLSPGQDLGDQDFAYRGTGSIGDLVWLDDGGDGVPDPDELPLANVTVDLVWAGADGVFDTDDDWVFPSQTTGTDGLYLFEGLPPGRYRVAVDRSTVGDDMQATTPIEYEITLGPDESYFEGDMGFKAGDVGLPMTGFDTDRFAPLGIGLVLLGLLLLAAAWLLEARRRRLRPVGPAETDLGEGWSVPGL